MILLRMKRKRTGFTVVVLRIKRNKQWFYIFSVVVVVVVVRYHHRWIQSLNNALRVPPAVTRLTVYRRSEVLNRKLKE